jgi:hypothetical protein
MLKCVGVYVRVLYVDWLVAGVFQQEAILSEANDSNAAEPRSWFGRGGE